jgi:diacylglycerol kinase family enzyme
VVQHLTGTEGVLGVLPSGTLNHFARDLGADDAATAMSACRGPSDPGRRRPSEQPDLRQQRRVGIYPELVRERERREHLLGKWGALAIAAGHVVRDFRPLEGSITADGDRRALAAAAVFIGNNRFSATGRAVGERACLDEGVLDVGIVAAPLGIRGRSQLAWTVAASRKWPGRVVRTAARQVQIDLHEGPRPIAFDGEQDDALATCTVEILPEALRVLVPGAA